jgi:hypothetical protein
VWLGVTGRLFFLPYWRRNFFSLWAGTHIMINNACLSRVVRRNYLKWKNIFLLCKLHKVNTQRDWPIIYGCLIWVLPWGNQTLLLGNRRSLYCDHPFCCSFYEL